jgi:hypothetical protein
MGRRVDILNSFTATLQAIPTLPPNAVVRGFKWLDQINSFPYITYNVQDSALVHISNNIRYYAMEIALRAYVRGESSQALLDDIMIDLENAIIHFQSVAAPALGVVEARIVSVDSDEGLMDPNGVTDMRIRITYQQDEII